MRAEKSEIIQECQVVLTRACSRGREEGDDLDAPYEPQFSTREIKVKRQVQVTLSQTM